MPIKARKQILTTSTLEARARKVYVYLKGHTCQRSTYRVYLVIYHHLHILVMFTLSVRILI